MKLFVFGSSLTSSYWNGAATYYRGMYKNLAELGFQITFAEPDAYGRQQHRDHEDFSYAEVIVYQSPRDIAKLLDQACEADLVIKHSGIGADDALLERGVLECQSPNTQVAFWDVDAPATLASVESSVLHPFRALIPEYDYIFTYGGGPPVIEHYERLGARACHPIYNALDPETHYPVAPIRQKPATWSSWAIACRTVSAGWKNSFWRRRSRRPNFSSRLAAKVGAISRCPRMFAGLGTSAPATTTS